MAGLVNWKKAFVYMMEQVRTRIASATKFREIRVPGVNVLPWRTVFWEGHLYWFYYLKTYRVSPEGKMEEVPEGDSSLGRLMQYGFDEFLDDSFVRPYLKIQSSNSDGNYYVTKEGSILNDSTWKEVGKVVPTGYEIYGEPPVVGEPKSFDRYFPVNVNLFFYRNKPYSLREYDLFLAGDHVFTGYGDYIQCKNLFWKDKDSFPLRKARGKILGAVYTGGMTTLFVTNDKRDCLTIYRYP